MAMADVGGPQWALQVPPPWAPGNAPPASGPLAQFGGAEPPAPDWFTAAIAMEPERQLVPVAGANIEMLAWGPRGKPGLIFVHGANAHADWWSFIAPLLADEHRVASLSLSGAGGSDWRAAYTHETFAAEIHECAKAAGLYEAEQTKPVFIGHSFGSDPVFFTACRFPERLSAAILIDAMVGGPPAAARARFAAEMGVARAPDAEGDTMSLAELGRRPGPARVYATMEEALGRFRFVPPQICANYYIADFIARRSLKWAPLESGGHGWTWRFDPDMMAKADRPEFEALAASRRTPIAHVAGGRSAIIRRMRQDGHWFLDQAPLLNIPDADHHVMLDQPLALVAALRGLLTQWRRS